MKLFLKHLLFFIVFCTTYSYAQKTDSISKLLEGLSGKAKVDKLNSLAEILVNSDPKKTKQFADEALKLSQQLNYQEGIADAYHKSGIYYYYNDDYENALKNYNKSLSLAKSLNNKQLIAQAFSWIGSLFRIQSDFKNAELNLNEAITYAKEINDDARIVYCLRNLGEVNRVQQKNAEAISYFNQALVIAEKINDQHQQAYIYGAIGEVYRQQSDFANALKNLNASTKKALSVNNKNLASNNYYSIGEIYLSESNYNKSLEFLKQSLTLAKELKDNIRIADCYAAMGDVYRHQGDAENAEDYYKRSLSISTQISYLNTKSYAYFTLGMLKKTDGQNDLAMEYFNRSLGIAKDINDYWRISDCMNMMGDIYTSRLNYKKAEESLLEALKICREIDNKATETTVLTSLSDLYFKKKEYDKAKKCAEEALVIANQIEMFSNKKSVAESLYRVYEKTGDYKKALEYHVLYKDLSDSLRHEENAKKLVQQQVQFEFSEKKARADLEQAKKDAVKESELNKQKTYTIFASIGLILLLALSIVIFRSQRKQKLVNIQLGKQKQQIEHQKQEITDSINYSKRIQTAILPESSQISRYIPNSFVLYKPKDIVSGDFYYFHVLKKKHTENEQPEIVIAAADCTGHGVPGALMSVVSHQSLDAAVRLQNEPAGILKRLNKKVKTTLKQTDHQDSTRDGLDIALATILRINDNESRVRFAMANRPVYLFKQGEFSEIKATKVAIGGHTMRTQEFEQHEMILSKGDTFYLCTDGYADQFGGEKNKKMTTSRFKDLLKGMQNKNMDEQKDELYNAMNTWKGNNEQVDDVLVIGIRI